jgi:hypothetical protein
MMVARRLAVLGDVNAGKASTLAMMGAELDRVRAAVWAPVLGGQDRAPVEASGPGPVDG